MDLMVLALVMGAGVPQQVLGDWVTPENKSIVRLETCADAPNTLCGHLVKLRSKLDREGDTWVDKKNDDPDLRSRPLMGLEILSGLKADGDKQLKGGRIYNPEDGNSYKAVVTLTGDDTLDLKGCVLFLCKTQNWRRATQEDWDRPVLERAE